MGRTPARHLAPPRRPGVRGSGQHLLAESLFAMLAVVLTTALVVGSLRAGTALEEPAPAITSPTSPSTPTTTAPAPTSTSGTARIPGGDNRLLDPGFEAGLAGWRSIGGARLERGRPPRRGQWAAILTSTATVDQGMARREVLRCRADKTYAATAWVRASKPGMLVEVNLLEYVQGRRYATDIVGAVLQDRGWQRLQVVHMAHRPGAALAVEVVIANVDFHVADWAQPARLGQPATAGPLPQ
jgi:hypothetical protein